MLALGLFATILYRTARQSIEPPNRYEKFIFGSVFWLAVGAALSQLFFFAKATAGSERALLARIAVLDGPLRDIQLLGFALLIIAGVSQRFVPMVYGLARPRHDRQTLIFFLINFDLVLNVSSYVGFVTTRKPLFAVALEVAYLLMPLWAVLLVRQLGIFSRPSQSDRTFKFVRTAYLWLLIACSMMPFFLPYGRAHRTDALARLYGRVPACLHRGFHQFHDHGRCRPRGADPGGDGRKP